MGALTITNSRWWVWVCSLSLCHTHFAETSKTRHESMLHRIICGALLTRPPVLHWVCGRVWRSFSRVSCVRVVCRTLSVSPGLVSINWPIKRRVCDTWHGCERAHGFQTTNSLTCCRRWAPITLSQLFRKRMIWHLVKKIPDFER